MFINFLLRWMVSLRLSFILFFVFPCGNETSMQKLSLTPSCQWVKPPPDAVQTDSFCKCVAAYINAFRIVFFFLPYHIWLTSIANGILSQTDCGNVYLQMWIYQLLKRTCASRTEQNWVFIAYNTFGRWRSPSRCSFVFSLMHILLMSAVSVHYSLLVTVI